METVNYGRNTFYDTGPRNRQYFTVFTQTEQNLMKFHDI